MTNYEKIMAELQNMSIEEFARTRIIYNDYRGCFCGDYGSLDCSRESAIKHEIEWLKKEVKE